MKIQHSYSRLICLLLFLPMLAAAQQAGDGYAELVKIHQQALELKKPSLNGFVPDYGADVLSRRATALKSLQQRLRAIPAGDWPVPEKVDYLAVWAELNDINFQQRVVRPWSRDPSFYLDMIRELPYTELPAPGGKLKQLGAKLAAVPAIVKAAKLNLDPAAGDLVSIAIFHLEHFDGVGQEEPYRAHPPEGIVGWYEEFAERAAKQQPELEPEARDALAAVREFDAWLNANRSRFKAPAAVGLENMAWYLRHVRLMPYTVDQVRTMGQAELQRAWTFLELERDRNEGLPQLRLAAGKQEYQQRVRDSEKLIRSYIRAHHLMTIPDYVGPQPNDAFWRPSPKRHFWEELQYRDPLVDHIHASIPGHRFDFLLHEHDHRPIRSSFTDSGRVEGWGYYCEEMLLQVGLLDRKPRTRELFYIAQIARAARIPAEMHLQSGEWDLEDAVRYMVTTVPYMEPNLAHYDLEIYLRIPPAFGLNYVIGKQQIENLLSDRARQLGDKFDLGSFHDRFLAAGMLPVSLVRWEMTGNDDEVKQFWKEARQE